MARSHEDSRNGNLLYYLNEALDWTVDQSEQVIRSPPLPHLPKPRTYFSSLSQRWWRNSSNPPVVNTPRSFWKLALSPSRSHLVVAKETQLELRSSSKKDPFYESLVLCLKVEPDPSPQLRHLVWSSAGQHFALGSSTGAVSVYDIRGALVCQLEAPSNEEGEQPLTTVFLEADGDGSVTLLTLHRTGLVRISSLQQVGCTVLASIDVAERVTGPLLAAAYSSSVGVLAVGTLEPQQPQCGHSASFRQGILYFRRLNQHPYLKTTMMTEDDLATPSHRSIMSKFFSTSAKTSDGICQLAISPDNRRMAVLHLLGGLSLWTFPSGQPLWTILSNRDCDPFHDLQSPLLSERQFSSASSGRILPTNPSSQRYSIEWWGSEDIIVLRENGCLSVIAAGDRSSRTGETPEWFEPFASLSSGTEDTFYILECESRRKRKRTTSDSAQVEPEDDEAEIDEMDSWNGWAKHYLKRLFAIDNDEPLRKKIRLVEQNYRLVAFKATTPEELFQRKIQDEEYGEALRLALKYGLDTDVVYQKQWQKSLMTRAAIEDFLTKISKRNWILHECLERVPDDLDSVRSLIEFGLEATDVDALLSAGPGDEGRLVRTTPARWIPSVSNKAAGTSLNQDEERELMARCESEYREGVLKSVASQSSGKLSLMQVELVRMRSRLLHLLDKLDAFELILGGRHRAPDRFKAEEFLQFRTLSPITAAVNYARDGQYDAVHVLFSRYADRLNKHRLAVLWNIPETEDPRSYALLLPELGDRIDDGSEVIPLNPEEDRILDWCECEEWYQCVESEDESVTELYSNDPLCRTFMTDRITRAQLSEWFDLRARQIDKQSRQTEYALTLVTLGMERGVEGLDTLYYDLLQLEMLVYDCRINVALSLEGYLQMPDLDKVKLMMAGTTEEMFIKHLSSWLFPFLTSINKKQAGQGEELFRQYMIFLSEKSLSYLEQIISHRATNSINHSWIKDDAFIPRLCVEILSDCQLTDQLTSVERILRVVPRGNKVDPAIDSQLLFLDRALNTIKTLDKYGVHQSFSFIKLHREDPEIVNKLMVSAVHREFKKTAQVTIFKVRSIISELQGTLSEVLTSIHPKMLHKIVIEGLLLSSDESKISLAHELMDLDGRARPMGGSSVSGDSSQLLSFQESVECLVKASREYFNSAVNSHDVAIKLGKLCLDQIKRDKSELIESELRLIAGLCFLEKSGISILPAELRANSKRSNLLSSALRKDPNLYRDIDAVLEAGLSLQIATSDESCKGEALRIIVNAALSNDDLSTAMTAARSLVRRGHQNGWEECALVGRHPDCPKNSERSQLLHFAVAHCPDEEIPDIFTQSLTKDAEMLQPQQDSSKSVFKKIISKSAKSILGTNKQSNDLKYSVRFESPVFYSEMAIQSDLIPLYKLHTNENQFINDLRTMQLGVNINMEQDQLLSHLASEAFKTDSLLAIAYLIHVNRSESFDETLVCLPASSFNHALALTASALRVIFKAEKKISEDVLLRSNILVKQARIALETLNSKQETDAFERRVASFEDFVQAKRLKEISESVDLTRFISDASYKEETILGLCMTEVEDQFQFAATLARRYNLDEWEANMTFLEYLICDSSLPVQEIETKVKKLNILTRIRSNHSRFIDRMTNMYDILDGCNYNKLIFFFSLFDPSTVEISGMAASSHLNTLRKLKSAAPSLEYKQLVSRDQAITNSVRLALIIPHLSEGNVHVFAKLAANFKLRSSAVFQAWTRHIFWNGDRPNASIPVTAEQWINRYHSCSSYLSRLSPEDVVTLMEGCIFGEGSADVTSEGRLEILRRCLKFCRQQRDSGASKHKNDAEWDSASWTGAETRLKELSSHLEMVLTSVLAKLSALGVDEEVIIAASCQLPGPDYYTDLLADMLARGLTLSEALHYSTAVNHREALDSGFSKALVKIAKEIGEARLAECLNEAAGVLEDSSIVHALTNLLKFDEIRRKLGPFLIEQLSSRLGETEVRRLVMTHAHNVLTAWNVSLPSIDQLTATPASLCDLISEASVDNLENLGDVLHTVGLVADSSDSTNLWKLWVIACLDNNQLKLVIKRSGPQVSQEYARVAFQVLSGPAPSTAIGLAVFCLEAASEVDQTTIWIPDILNLISLGTMDPKKVDNSVLRFLIDRRLVPRLVSGPLYSRLIGYLLEEFDADWLEKTACDLKEAGFVLEASYLIAETHSIHPGFRTLDVLSQLLTKFTG